MSEKFNTDEHTQRRNQIREKMRENNLDGFVFYNNLTIKYLTGFNFLPTERPIALLVTSNKTSITIPKLEENRVQQNKAIDTVYTYYDYPGNNNGKYYNNDSETPENQIKTMIENSEINHIGCDMNGAPGIMGYEGPKLDQILGKEVQQEKWVQKMRLNKTEKELEYFYKGAEYADESFRRIREKITPGVNETSFNLEVKKETTETVLNKEEVSTSPEKIAYYRILSGKNTYNPHGIVENREIKRNDILLPGMALAIKGYFTELERTMFLGEPSKKQANYFEIMKEAQDIAIESAAKGVKASKVDQNVHDYFKEQGVLKYARHHTGHGLGLESHEPPYIDRGNNKKLQENQVISLEPGLYVEDVGGFRHSDTFIVKENGLKRITKDPRELEANIIRK